MPTNIPKTYEPRKVEDALYKQWESLGLFKPSDPNTRMHPNDPNKKPFSISMPPPNATGTLHLGHAVMLAIEDIMTRWARMSGRRTLWLPGIDHASIATETKVEKILLAEKKKTKQEMGREKFLARIEKYVSESKSTIENQVRKMGSSCDWSRERYTLDAGLSRLVGEVFVKMYNDGLIYRGHRIVNWCTRCQSTLADDEVEYKELYAPFYTFTYDKNFPIPIATTRPETKLGDTAVAVHPDDKRYKKYIGKTLNADFLGTPLQLKIIADKSIDPKFGTGALGVTPAHSLADAELAAQYGLKTFQVIDEHGKIKEGISKFGGQYVLEARENIAEQLEKQGLLQEQKDIVHNLSVCYRCDTPIEPLVSEQWFVDVNKPPFAKASGGLRKMAIDAVKSGQIKILPKRFEKIYYHWMDNLHDWCISRQIWFGHRIPVWQKKLGQTKTMGFYEKVVPQVFAGKTKTYRLREHGFVIGDKVAFENSQTGKMFGTGTITNIEKTIVAKLPLKDKAHGATYDKRDELVAAFQRHYPHLTVNENTPAFVYTYKFSPRILNPKSGAVNITFYAHGTTGDNEASRASGHFDVELSQLGIKQANELKKHSARKNYDVVFTSDLKRAYQTAAIAFGDKIKIIQDKRLREIDYGKLTRTDFRKIEPRQKEYITAPFPGGESYQDATKRIEDWLADIADKYAGKKIAIIAHGAPQLALEVLLNNKTWTQAINEDWRKQKKWRPGWDYALSEIKKVSAVKPEGAGWEQDPDTLDTWFSSAMWTFSTLLDKPKVNDTLESWIKRNRQAGKDLAVFHPTTVMETGYDILFFWVARMILMTTYVLDEVPFRAVYLHGLVRDRQGRKMSKSLDNGIDPLDMIKKYGADATRLSLVIGTAPGNDTRLYEEKIAGYRNFVNKIWNISRFILLNQKNNLSLRGSLAEAKAKADDRSNLGIASPRSSARNDNLTLADKWIQIRLNKLIAEVTAHFENYEFSPAGEKIYDFLWHDLADWYVEISKQQNHTLAPQILLDAIKLLHPFTPFVTEEIFQRLKKSGLIESNDKWLMTSSWPKTETQGFASLQKNADKIETDFSALQSLVTAIRDLRAKYNLPYSEKLDAAITTAKHKDLFQEQERIVEQLTKVRIQVLPSLPAEPEQFLRAHTSQFDIYLKLAAEQMREQELRLGKEIENLKKYIAGLEAKLADNNFRRRAPADIVAAEKQKLQEAKDKLKKL